MWHRLSPREGGSQTGKEGGLENGDSRAEVGGRREEGERKLGEEKRKERKRREERGCGRRQ